MEIIEIIFFVIAIVVSLIVGYFLKTFILFRDKNFVEIEIKEKKLEAEKQAEKILQNARLKNEKKEEELNLKDKNLSEKDFFIISEIEKYNKKKEELEKKKEVFLEEKMVFSKKKEEISGMSKVEVLVDLKKEVENENKQDLYVLKTKLETFGIENLEKKAKDIIALSIQKFSKNIDNNLVTSSVKIPNEETKGKIIGKEGRNIKSFEKETGVQLIIDEKPNEILISSFDPIRREVAVSSLNHLIKDGMITPAKIEVVVLSSRENVVEMMDKIGLETAEEVGLQNTPKELLNILGRLHYRSSYGQNILKHSIEMAHIAEVMAEELGADPYVAKAGALFHDIGKAVDFETKGTHVEIGIKILRKNGINEEIIKAMQAHHREYPNENLESYIVDAADAISGARPGARSDNADMYIKKLEGLEKITKEFDGVSSAYALSAGREVRVFVKPDEIDDINAAKMARDIALRIEEELKYPGEIKIAVIREQKIIEFAR